MKTPHEEFCHVEAFFHPMLSDFRKSSFFGDGGSGSQVSPACPSGNRKMCVEVNMAHWWYETGVTSKHSEENLSQCQCFRQRIHWD
jgi:hypothetical protein